MKKILSLILAALMTASCAAFVAADDAAVEEVAAEAVVEDAAVEDVIDEAQEQAILFLNDLGIYKGDGTDLVNDANSKLQRWHMALFVSRLSTGWLDDASWENGSANNSTFTDLGEVADLEEKYLGAISYANQQGIIEGYSATKFAPADGITYRDALTMVCRTLGYKGLAYPWGYIQQGVELGLTEDVDVAYTDILTRGEIAVIIYNAMFAELKAGGTLAKSIFDVDFGWENIVIVSTDEVGFELGGKEYTSAVRAKKGYVGFKILDDMGNLSAKTYYVKSSEFEFEGHDEELAVGSVYAALFTIDSDLVEIISYVSLLDATVENFGITDDAGVAVDKLPILKALALDADDKTDDYVIVDEWTDNRYVSFDDNELMVYGFKDVEYFEIDETLVGIDMVSGNILEQAADGTWTIAWFWNNKLQRYYEYYYDEDAAATDLYETDQLISNILINWMSDAEFTEWYADAIKKVLGKEVVYSLLASGTTIGKDPYAKLNLFNTDKTDDEAEIATYKSYKLGYFSNISYTDKCATCDKAVPGYKIVDLNPNANTKVNWIVEHNYDHDKDPVKGHLWINVDANKVTGFEKADGGYNDGYVLYNYNQTTGEIEVVKYIAKTVGADNMDDDSYYMTGVMQAFSTSKQTITVDGVVYPYGYDSYSTGIAASLEGVNEYLKKGASTITQTQRETTGWYLDNLLMQYVEVLVLDGRVVDVKALNAAADAVIVVVDYAGITSDGYIAVYGYSTADGVLKLYKINSYNGWKQGDYRYNPWNAADDEAFNFGTIYTIASHDKDTNSYGVYTYDIDEYADEISTAKHVNIQFQNGYRVVTDITDIDASKHTVTVDAQKSTDTYILISRNGDDARNDTTVAGFAGAFNDGLINVVTGYNLPAENEVTGKQIYASGGKYVIVVDDHRAILDTFFYEADTDGNGLAEVYVGDDDGDPRTLDQWAPVQNAAAWRDTTSYAAAGTDLGIIRATLEERYELLEDLFGLDENDHPKWEVKPHTYTNLSGRDFTWTMNNDIGYFLYLENEDRGVVEAAYDDAQIEDIYLLGSTMVEFYALNVLTGKFDYVVKTANVDLEDGTLYKTLNGTVIGVIDENVLDGINGAYTEDTFGQIFILLNNTYGRFYYGVDFDETTNRGLTVVRNAYWESDNTYAAIGRGFIHNLLVTDDEDDNDADTIKADYLKVLLARDLGMTTALDREVVQNKVATTEITDLRIVNISKDKYGDYTATTLSSLNEDTRYTYYALYNADSKFAVIYVVEELTNVLSENEATYATEENEIPLVLRASDKEFAHYKAPVVFDWSGKEVVDEDDNVVGVTIDKVYFGYTWIDFCENTHDHLGLGVACEDNGKVMTTLPDSLLVTDKTIIDTQANLKDVPLCHEDLELVTWNTTAEDYEDAYWSDNRADWNEGEDFHYSNLTQVVVGSTTKYVKGFEADITDIELGDTDEYIQFIFTLDNVTCDLVLKWNGTTHAFELHTMTNYITNWDTIDKCTDTSH